MFPILTYDTSTGNPSIPKDGESSLHQGGFVESNIKTIDSNYSILENDFILNCNNTNIINLTLPNSTTIGRVYRIYTKNQLVNILTSGIQVINNGIKSLTLNNYAMLTLRLIESDLWRIGD